MISGINHITLAVSELSRSFNFYTTVLGLEARARWSTGAYLSAGDLWLCLSQGKVSPSDDYTHIAFSLALADFAECQIRLDAARIELWQSNTSEGDSIYCLDPDGHKLELHVGSLASRLAAMAHTPPDGLVLFDGSIL